MLLFCYYTLVIFISCLNFSIQAVDLDRQKSITYTIIDGDTGKFFIDEQSGRISTREALDYERQTEYVLVVSTREATGSEPSSSATVIITVVVSRTLFYTNNCSDTVSVVVVGEFFSHTNQTFSETVIIMVVGEILSHTNHSFSETVIITVYCSK